MVNLTILSLSISSCFSLSPIFAGNSHYVSQSNFKFFINTLFYDPKKLILEKNSFIKGISSVVIAENQNKIHLKSKNEIYHDKNYAGDSFDYMNFFTEDVIIIRDCTFTQISVKDNDEVIKIENPKTAYITSLTFDQCSARKHLFTFSSQSTTLSHICCSKLHRITDNNPDGLFLNYKAPSKTFLKIIYSTVTGTNNELSSTSEIIKLYDSCHYKVQCLNISNFKISNSDNCYVFHFNGPYCVNYIMNTFYNLEAKSIMYIFNNNAKNDDSIFFGMSNFVNSKFYQSCIKYKSGNDAKSVVFYNCLFTCQSGSGEKFFYIEGSQKLTVSNCYLGTDFGDLTNGLITSEGENKYGKTELNILAHYNVDGICYAELNPNANPYACNNYTCPDDKGCGADAFNFPAGAETYTEKFHPDIDPPTPPPTNYFSDSVAFSYSKLFSSSKGFSSSFMFSFSNYFTKTSGFTKTGYFSKSSEFSETKKFSFSSFFSKSELFSKSSYFSHSDYFTKTTGFTKTGAFSETEDFTNSILFSKSEYFSESGHFSHSGYFTKTGGFTKTGDFTKTGFFSKTDDFTETKDFSYSGFFSDSHPFEPTDHFNHSNYFTESSYFSETVDFSKSIFFSDSKEFTKSNLFTQTGQFSTSLFFTNSLVFPPTEDFNHSHHFTPSSNFTTSNIFSSSSLFTHTSDFTKSGLFSKSHLFSSSFYFSNSKYFSETKKFSSSFYFTGSNELSNLYLTSLHFTSSSVFSKSDVFEMSYFFTNSKKFSESFSFSFSKSLIHKSGIIIDIKQEESHHVSTGIKIGIGIAAGLAGLAGIILGIIFLRKRKLVSISDFDEETITLPNDSSFFTSMQNPLNTMLSEDDPFQDEFD